jgi:hypothetical protein
MRPVAMPVLMMLIAVTSVLGEEKPEPLPIPLEKWKFEYAAKTWGLKVKSASYNAHRRRYTFVVEFTRDLKTEELKSLIEAFPSTHQAGGSKKLAFYFFDKDNVIVQKRSDFGTASELTGVKGDAFRLETFGASSMVREAVKAELRAK